ncbi:hypothetical protein ECDEC3C_2244 [Escherichia coli DEC3C]|nr:hypothetical protein ECDEC3C_2244 [Escherichia coli DEC3C]
MKNKSLQTYKAFLASVSFSGQSLAFLIMLPVHLSPASDFLSQRHTLHFL